MSLQGADVCELDASILSGSPRRELPAAADFLVWPSSSNQLCPLASPRLSTGGLLSPVRSSSGQLCCGCTFPVTLPSDETLHLSARLRNQLKQSLAIRKRECDILVPGWTLYDRTSAGRDDDVLLAVDRVSGGRRMPGSVELRMP